MKRTAKFLGILVLGAVATALVDQLLGIPTKDPGFLLFLLHKVVYMGWGAFVVEIVRR